MALKTQAYDANEATQAIQLPKRDSKQAIALVRNPGRQPHSSPLDLATDKNEAEEDVARPNTYMLESNWKLPSSPPPPEEDGDGDGGDESGYVSLDSDLHLPWMATLTGGSDKPKVTVDGRSQGPSAKRIDKYIAGRSGDRETYPLTQKAKERSEREEKRVHHSYEVRPRGPESHTRPEISEKQRSRSNKAALDSQRNEKEMQNRKVSQKGACFDAAPGLKPDFMPSRKGSSVALGGSTRAPSEPSKKNPGGSKELSKGINDSPIRGGPKDGLSEQGKGKPASTSKTGVMGRTSSSTKIKGKRAEEGEAMNEQERSSGMALAEAPPTKKVRRAEQNGDTWDEASYPKKSNLEFTSDFNKSHGGKKGESSTDGQKRKKSDSRAGHPGKL